MFIQTISFLLVTMISLGLKGQDNSSYAVDHIAKELTSKAHVVVRKDETVVSLESSEKYNTTFFKVLTIMSKKGENHVRFRAFYKEGSTRLRDIEVKIYDKNGGLIRSSKSKEIEDFVAYDGMSLISDGRWKTFDYQPLEYPVTVEMKWREVSESTLSLPTWWPINGTNISVEQSSYKIINKTNIDIRVGERNLSKYPIRKSGDLSFQLENQAVIFSESYSPSIFDRYPMVFASPTSYQYEGYTGSYRTWEEFGEWIYRSLLSDKEDLDRPKAKKDLDNILSGNEDKIETIRKVYDYVQENTRYVLIGLDEGGLVPLSAQKVHDVKYGDCKALTFYMKSLLDVYGIKANYVIVRAGANMPEDIFYNYPSVAPANHVILNIPMETDTIWLDCTSHHNPFNYLGDFTDDRLALQVGIDGGKLVRTPMYKANKNKNIYTGDIQFSNLGDISVDLTIEGYGLKIDRVMALKTLDIKDFDKYLETNLLSQFDKLEVQSHEISLDEDRVSSNQNYSFTASRYGELAGDYMLFGAAFLSLPIPKLKKDSNRENDIFFSREEESRSTIIYRFPKGFYWKLPKDVVLESDYGYYHLKVMDKEDGSYEITRLFVLNKGLYQADQYKEIKLFFDKIRKAERTKYSVTNKS